MTNEALLDVNKTPATRSEINPCLIVAAIFQGRVEYRVAKQFFIKRNGRTTDRAPKSEYALFYKRRFIEARKSERMVHYPLNL